MNVSKLIINLQKLVDEGNGDRDVCISAYDNDLQKYVIGTCEDVFLVKRKIDEKVCICLISL